MYEVKREDEKKMIAFWLQTTSRWFQRNRELVCSYPNSNIGGQTILILLDVLLKAAASFWSQRLSKQQEEQMVIDTDAHSWSGVLLTTSSIGIYVPKANFVNKELCKLVMYHLTAGVSGVIILIKSFHSELS